MAKEDKITPSQRLLDLIRKPSGASGAARAASPPAAPASKDAASDQALGLAATEASAPVSAVLPPESPVSSPAPAEGPAPVLDELFGPTASLVWSETPAAVADPVPVDDFVIAVDEPAAELPLLVLEDVPAAVADPVPVDDLVIAVDEPAAELPPLVLEDVPAAMAAPVPAEDLVIAVDEPAAELPPLVLEDVPAAVADPVPVDDLVIAVDEPAAELPPLVLEDVPAAVADPVPVDDLVIAVDEPAAELPPLVLEDVPAAVAAPVPVDDLVFAVDEPAAELPPLVLEDVPVAVAEPVPAADLVLAVDEPAAELPPLVLEDVPAAVADPVPVDDLVIAVDEPAAELAPLVLEDVPAAVADQPLSETTPEVADAAATEVPGEAPDAVIAQASAQTSPTASRAVAAKTSVAALAKAWSKVSAKASAKKSAKAPGKPARQWRSLFSLGKATHVGVDISQSELVCVKIRGHDAGFEVLATEVVAVPAGVEPGSQTFVELLRDALARLCGPGPLPGIWAAAQSARANLQFLTIPKVASRQVDNAVFWTAKKELGFEEGGVIFDFERRGEVAEKGTMRLGAMAYTTPREAVSIIRSDFAKAGFPLAGLTLEPFAHQNLFRRRIITEPTTGAVANLHVGQHWSRLEIFSNGNLMFVRVIKTSLSGMEQAVLEALESRGGSGPGVSPAPAPAPAPAGVTPPEEMVLDLDALGTSDSGLILEFDPAPLAPVAEPEPQPVAPTGPAVAVEPGHARELVEAIITGSLSVDDGHPGQGLEIEEIMDMLRPVASRLVRQVEMTLKHYRESLGQEPVTRLTVSGVLGGSDLFIDFIRDHLGLPCAPLDILSGRRLPPVLGQEHSLPPAFYTQALGLALSDAAITPSVFSTYKDRAAVHTSRLLEQWSLVGLAAVLGTMALFSFAAVSKRQGLEKERDGLSQQLAVYGTGLDSAALTHKSEELRAKVEAMRRYVSRNRIVGVWEEALALAPEGVGLGTLTAECGAPEKPAKPDKSAKPATPQPQGGKDPNAPVARLVVEGVVTGDSRLFDSMLASYVVALEGSPLFEDVSVKRNELESLEGGASGLRFVVTLNLSENQP